MECIYVVLIHTHCSVDDFAFLFCTYGEPFLKVSQLNVLIRSYDLTNVVPTAHLWNPLQ